MEIILPDALPTFVPDGRYTVEEWLAIEEATGEKYEFHDGRLISVRAMAGGTWKHALIAGNVAYLGGGVVRGLAESVEKRMYDCHLLSSDLRIYIPELSRYLYPDLTIVCGDPKFDDTVPSAIVNPRIVFEVTSPSSREYDEDLKFNFYSRLSPLREYVIVHQHRRAAEVRSRPDATSPWRTRVFAEDDGGFSLDSLGGAAFPYEDVYRGWKPD